jgi:hypothetical protein
MIAHAPTQTNHRLPTLSRLLTFAALAIFFAISATSAKADSNSAYNFSGTLSNGSAFSGTLDFDTNASGVTTLVDTTFTVAGVSFACNGGSSNLCTVENSGFAEYFQSLSGSALVVLTWSPFNVSNPPPAFSFSGGYCINCIVGATLTVTTGSATAVPEPSTWALLAFGIFFVAFLFRPRRSVIVSE